MSSTSPISTSRLTAPARRRPSIIGWVATSPVGTTVTRNPSFDPGYAASRPRITPFRSAAAPAAVSPSRSRPFTNIQRTPRRSSRVAPGDRRLLSSTTGWTSSTQATGIHNAGVRTGAFMPPKGAGVTPTMVYGRSPMRSVRPTESGSASNAADQNAAEITTTGAAPGRSSSGDSARPSAAGTPSTWK